MQKKKAQLLTLAASLCLLAIVARSAGANATASTAKTQDRDFVQTTGEMTANTRLFGPIGPGLRAVRRSADGRTYVLASPSPGLVVYDAKGKQLFTVAESAATPGAKPSTAGITFGEDCD